MFKFWCYGALTVFALLAVHATSRGHASEVSEKHLKKTENAFTNVGFMILCNAYYCNIDAIYQTMTNLQFRLTVLPCDGKPTTRDDVIIHFLLDQMLLTTYELAAINPNCPVGKIDFSRQTKKRTALAGHPSCTIPKEVEELGMSLILLDRLADCIFSTQSNANAKPDAANIIVNAFKNIACTPAIGWRKPLDIISDELAKAVERLRQWNTKECMYVSLDMEEYIKTAFVDRTMNDNGEKELERPGMEMMNGNGVQREKVLQRPGMEMMKDNGVQNERELERLMAEMMNSNGVKREKELQRPGMEMMNGNGVQREKELQRPGMEMMKGNGVQNDRELERLLTEMMNSNGVQRKIELERPGKEIMNDMEIMNGNGGLQRPRMAIMKDNGEKELQHPGTEIMNGMEIMNANGELQRPRTKMMNGNNVQNESELVRLGMEITNANGETDLEGPRAEKPNVIFNLYKVFVYNNIRNNRTNTVAIKSLPNSDDM